MDFKEYVTGAVKRERNWTFYTERYKFRWLGYNESIHDFDAEMHHDNDLDVLDYITRDHDFTHQFINHRDHGQLLHVERVNGELVFHGLDDMIKTFETMKLDCTRDREHLISLKTLALRLNETK